MKILLVEDDDSLGNTIQEWLRLDDYIVDWFQDGESASNALLTQKYDCILLDRGLPKLSGDDLLKNMRQYQLKTPTLIITAMGALQDKIQGLDLGADDYLTKPFSATELMARIRVSLRHAQRSIDAQPVATLSVGELTMDLVKRLVYLEGKEIHVTPLEYNLLALLFKNMGKVLTTGYILKEIYGINYGTDTQALRALMAGLRHKIEKIPAKPRYILTEIGVGYRLVDE